MSKPTPPNIIQSCVACCTHRMRTKFRTRVVFISLIVVYHVCILWIATSPGEPEKCGDKNYIRALLQRVSPSDDVILLAMVDAAFVDMAVNFYRVSLKPHNIENYLFIGVGQDACELLRKLSLACHTFAEDDASAETSVFDSEDFNRKMNIRTAMILGALRAGFKVLHSDLDVVFLQNPIPEMKSLDVDMAILWDHTILNAGFLMANPTTTTINIYRQVKRITDWTLRIDDQHALHYSVGTFRRWYGARIHVLDKRRYASGAEYFEVGKRAFAGDVACDDCVVVHNNWIASKEAKVYRFKEHRMWMIDDNQYYSSPSRKYLVYDNSYQFGTPSATLAAEIRALTNALAIGQVLNRTVILSAFHCSGSFCQDNACDDDPDLRCPLNTNLKVSAFDQQFGGLYREHTFLGHEKVPKPVTESKLFLILGDEAKTLAEARKLKIEDGWDVKAPQRPAGATSQEIQQWFSNDASTVLRFHSLYNAFHSFSDQHEQASFQEKAGKAFVFTNYRQMT